MFLLCCAVSLVSGKFSESWVRTSILWWTMLLHIEDFQESISTKSWQKVERCEMFILSNLLLLLRCHLHLLYEETESKSRSSSSGAEGLTGSKALDQHNLLPLGDYSRSLTPVTEGSWGHLNPLILKYCRMGAQLKCRIPLAQLQL